MHKLPHLPVELLEPRRLLAVTAAIESGVLRVRGDDAANAIRLSRSGSDVIVTHWSGSTSISQTFSLNDFAGAGVEGAGGNDTLWIKSGSNIPGVTLDGGTGDDQLFGGDGSESLLGGDGDDVLWGAAGNDTLRGGDGNDTLLRDAGDDSLTGDAGDDQIQYDGPGGGDHAGIREEGVDTLIAPGGSTTFAILSGKTLTVTGTGGADDMYLEGDFDNHIYVGLNGTFAEFLGATTQVEIDTIRLRGLGGDDMINLPFAGFEEYDPTVIVEGDDGDDHISAGEGLTRALIYGGSGDDICESLDIQALAKFADGGPGIDTIIADLPPTVDLRLMPGVENVTVRAAIVYGNSLNNRIEITDSGTAYGFDGNDTLISQGDDADSLYGGDGNDSLVGGGGFDWLDGGNGIDTIVGDYRSDRLNGEVVNAPIGPTAFIDTSGSTKQLVVLGTSFADAIMIRNGSDPQHVTVQIWTNSSTPAFTGSFLRSDFARVFMWGLGGDDSIWIRGGDVIPNVSMHGGRGDDFMVGAATNDFLIGGEGNDRLYGDQGDDTFAVDDDGAPDTVDGGPGDDSADVDFADFANLVRVEHVS